MRALLFLSVTGAALYALLVVTQNVIPADKVEDTFAGQTQLYNPADRDLRSWGSNLPALVISQPPSPQSPQQNAAYGRSPNREGQSSERMAGADDRPAASENKLTASEMNGAEGDLLEWAKVTLAARVHSEASVSSAIIRFYPPGTVLKVVRRENGWLELLDPATQERGWVFEKYLSSIDGPSAIQAAIDSSTEDRLAEAGPARPVSPGSKNRSPAAKPTAQVADNVITKSELRRGRWARRDARRRGLGLLMFGGFARFEPAAGGNFTN